MFWLLVQDEGYVQRVECPNRRFSERSEGKGKERHIREDV